MFSMFSMFSTSTSSRPELSFCSCGAPPSPPYTSQSSCHLAKYSSTPPPRPALFGGRDNQRIPINQSINQLTRLDWSFSFFLSFSSLSSASSVQALSVLCALVMVVLLVPLSLGFYPVVVILASTPALTWTFIWDFSLIGKNQKKELRSLRPESAGGGSR